ncbi:MAG: hypothetical protein ACJAYS_000950 [Lentimonas sp.]|jgi:hypothetical protein
MASKKGIKKPSIRIAGSTEASVGSTTTGRNSSNIAQTLVSFKQKFDRPSDKAVIFLRGKNRTRNYQVLWAYFEIQTTQLSAG